MWLLYALTGFQGRLGRQQFWLSLLVLGSTFAAVQILLFAIGFGEANTVSGRTVLSTGEVREFSHTSFALPPPVSLVLAILFVVPFASIALKRRHDRNVHGYEVIVYLVLYFCVFVLQMFGLLPQVSRPFVDAAGLLGTLYLLVVLGCLRGTVGANDFGPDPLLTLEKA